MILNEDQYLVARLKNSSEAEAAFKELVEKYQKRLYTHIRKMVISHSDTDDILQDTFIKVYRNINNFREDSSLFTWLYRIATNETLNFLKKKKRQYVFSALDYEDQMVQSLKNDAYFDGDEAAFKLEQAILKLPEKQRLVFNMKYYDEMKYQQISDILDTSVGALKASYHHAVKKIEKFIITE
jgi:RNA polymerase sigma-70 factor (ECF subfamily)